jgi:polyhydroxyalkanoate synthesis regulator phasin
MRIFNSIRRPFGGYIVDPGELQAEAARAVEERFSRHIDRQLNIGFGRLTRRMEFIMASLQEIIELAAAQRTKIDSLNTLMDGVRAQIAQLLENAGSDQTTKMLVDQVFAKLKENDAALDEAIAENTSAPGPAPTPTPVEPPAPTPPVDETAPATQG